MADQKAGLFREEVYQAMEKSLLGPSDHNGVEEALRMIIRDTKLHNFIRKYAKKNAITRRGWGDYGHGNDVDGTLRHKHIEFWRGVDPWTSKKGDKHAPHLYIGPDPAVDTQPIFLGVYKIGDSWRGQVHYWETLLLEERDGSFYTLLNPYKLENPKIWENDVRSYHNRRIVDMGIFDGVTAAEILAGLEQSVAKILKFT